MATKHTSKNDELFCSGNISVNATTRTQSPRARLMTNDEEEAFETVQFWNCRGRVVVTGIASQFRGRK